MDQHFPIILIQTLEVLGDLNNKQAMFPYLNTHMLSSVHASFYILGILVRIFFLQKLVGCGVLKFCIYTS